MGTSEMAKFRSERRDKWINESTSNGNVFYCPYFHFERLFNVNVFYGAQAIQLSAIARLSKIFLLKIFYTK